MFFIIKKIKNTLKTYNYINNDVLINFSITDSWTTWCMERCDCNRTTISNTIELYYYNIFVM
jgi:hypothetical protein